MTAGAKRRTLGPASAAQEMTALSKSVLLGVFGERNAERRAKTIERVFADDILFIDHIGAHHGRAEIGKAVETLHARLPGFRFTPVSEPQVMEGAARLHWTFGPPSDPAKISGSDTILVRDGQIVTLLVFLDHQSN